MKNYFILIAAVFLITASVAGHYLTEEGYLSIGGNTTITDMADRSLTVPSPINHVLTTSPTLTVIVYMVAPEKLLAFNYETTAEEQAYMPDQYKKLPSVGGWYGSQDGDYEQFISMNPDVILDSVTPCESGGTDTATLAALKARQQQFGSIPDVGVIDSSNITAMNPSIEFIGKLLGSKDAADKLTAFNDKVQKEVNDTVSKIPENEKVTVYYARSSNGLQTAPSGSAHTQLIELCGGTNVVNVPVQGGEGMMSVSMEQVLKWNPEVIITTDPTFYANIYKSSGWSGISAVKNKRVYFAPQAPFKWFAQPTGANMIIGIPWTAKVLYPDKFKGLNLSSEVKEFYSEFYHYNLSDEQVKDILVGSGIKSSDTS
jgi:iron complex transport system substrate-binding protein